MNYPPFPVIPGMTHGLIIYSLDTDKPQLFIDKLIKMGRPADAVAYKKARKKYLEYRSYGHAIPKMIAEQERAIDDYEYSYWLDWFTWALNKYRN